MAVTRKLQKMQCSQRGRHCELMQKKLKHGKGLSGTKGFSFWPLVSHTCSFLSQIFSVQLFPTISPDCTEKLPGNLYKKAQNYIFQNSLRQYFLFSGFMKLIELAQIVRDCYLDKCSLQTQISKPCFLPFISHLKHYGYHIPLQLSII